ncbi:hypothetical protein HH308_11435 [Gordonia sp. TBRC 11910]|uniref:Carbohydrate kinase PfkB domain-containing protein n=1 Tax=Gordonia asplenii TaxID=2725283 RepID=A0A848KZJ4_9ACTN|nr:PfkB family carbohydrate kinase [Gordonia asplenii]NMO01823.1 hypothetical protein [Gordonia asplenii]
MMSARVYVIGDVMLDRDIVGESDRRCPDSVGPVIDTTEVCEGPAGAGLAAMIATQYGADVSLITALADDPPGERLAASLRDQGIDVVAVPLCGSTPERTRIRSGGRTLARVDCGDGIAPHGDIGIGAHHFDGADAILVSDYGRGLARCVTLRSALARSAAAGVPVVWDPHPRGADPVDGIMLMTPNLVEAQQQNIDRRLAEGASPREFGVRAVVVTGGENGATLFTDGRAPQRVPIADNQLVEADDVDTCGAGDAFAAAVTVELARGTPLSEAVAVAVERATAMISEGLRVVGANRRGRGFPWCPSIPNRDQCLATG